MIFPFEETKKINFPIPKTANEKRPFERANAEEVDQ